MKRTTILHTFISVGIFIFFFLQTACDKAGLIRIDGVEFLGLEECWQFDFEEILIDDSLMYQDLLDFRSNTSECSNAELPAIDFAKRTLFGKKSEVTSCEVFYFRNVFADPENKEYIYEIIVSNSSAASCTQQTFSSMNWLSVPKMPENYTLRFDLKYEN